MSKKHAPRSPAPPASRAAALPATAKRRARRRAAPPPPEEDDAEAAIAAAADASLQPDPDAAEGEDGCPYPFTPVTFLRNRRSGWTPARQRAFIAALAELGSVAAAAKSVGLSRRSAEKLRERPGAESFAEAWDAAHEDGLDAVRAALFARARLGVVMPRYRNGRLVGLVHRYDLRAALAALSVREPDLIERRAEAKRRRDYARSMRELDAQEAARKREAEEVAEANRKAWEAAAQPPSRPRPEPRIRRL